MQWLTGILRLDGMDAVEVPVVPGVVDPVPPVGQLRLASVLGEAGLLQL